MERSNLLPDKQAAGNQEGNPTVWRQPPRSAVCIAVATCCLLLPPAVLARPRQLKRVRPADAPDWWTNDAAGMKLAHSARSTMPPGYLAWDYTPKLCNPNGTCNEATDLPSPRTRFSTPGRRQMQDWWYTHDWFVAAARRATDPDLILIGDSITESYVGSSMLRSSYRCDGVPEALLDWTKSSPWREGLVLAISGDQTQHLLWRFTEEFPAQLRARRAVVNLHIGTNNLGAGHLPSDTARGVRACAAWLLHSTNSSVLVNLLLPRGDNHRLKGICPPRCFQAFAPAISRANELITQHVRELSRQFSGRVALASCGHLFSSSTTPSNVNKRLMPDSLHPNEAGHRLLLSCLGPQLLALRRRTARTVVDGH
ncbi:SGNH hydrolase-type esterase domain-containing protein [Pavlovales sp. CCMP2436]|nr:SGNH hydrolase-type esterase domain-containing protein [Pavlovales sp. CCMP2436]